MLHRILILWASLLLWAMLPLATPAFGQTITPPVIGPGTPCQVTWTEATSAALLTGFHVYMDPPSTGVVIGTTPITATVAATILLWSVCNATPLIPDGNHTVAVSAFGPGGESVSATVPFSLTRVAPSAPTVTPK